MIGPTTSSAAPSRMGASRMPDRAPRIAPVGRAVAAALAVVGAVGAARAQEPLVLPAPAPAAGVLPFPHLPPLVLDSVRNDFGAAQKITRERGLQGRVLWIDATANLDRVNTAEKIAALVSRIRSAGFNTIVFDVKPIVGETLYLSKHATQMTEWVKPGRAATLPAGFDPLKEMAARAREAGLSCFVSLNAFSEGHRDYPGRGLAFVHPEWQTVLYEPELRVRANGEEESAYLVSDRVDQPPRQADDLAVYTDPAKLPKLPPGSAVAALDPGGRVAALVDGPAEAGMGIAPPTGGALLVGLTPAAGQYLREKALPGQTLELLSRPVYVPAGQRLDRQVPVMTNPHLPAVRQRLLAMVAEIVSGYPVDGVVFDDRLRYAALNADFSEPARAAFEAWVGRRVTWPDDVFRWEVSFPTLAKREVPGPLFDAWATFRALTLRNFLAEVVKTVRGIRADAQVGTYVGSWYPDYPDLGANWAADDLAIGYRFHDDAFRRTGWAGLVDFVVTGCYHTTASIREAAEGGTGIGATVEAAGQLSNRAVNDQTLVYAGLSLDRFKGNPDGLRRALQAAAATTQGIMCFDLSHDIDPLWEVFADAFKTPAAPPHRAPGLMAAIRAEKEKRRASGVPDPPVILYRGVSGTGF